MEEQPEAAIGFGIGLTFDCQVGRDIEVEAYRAFAGPADFDLGIDIVRDIFPAVTLVLPSASVLRSRSSIPAPSRSEPSGLKPEPLPVSVATAAARAGGLKRRDIGKGFTKEKLCERLVFGHVGIGCD